MGLLRLAALPLFVLALAGLAAACSGGSDSGGGESESSNSEPPAPLIYDAADFPEALNDASLPDGVSPDSPVGSYGYSRYVWTQTSEGLVATLIEGPRGPQVRCQDEALPCSYAKLKALLESGDDIPPELGMTSAELATLVAQLDLLNAKLASYTHPDQLCADGYARSSTQNPNMGMHMVNASYMADGFVVDKPEIILLASEGGEGLRQSEIGDCVDGKWTGDPSAQVVGAAYMLAMTDEHPEAFAGPIDNWHIHHNTCAGADSEVRAIIFERELCEAEGGQLMEVMPIWMMHAYAAPGFESQQGVFAMFNGSIWPLSSSEDIFDLHTEAHIGENAIMSPINNFSFGSTIEVKEGDAVVFSNSDTVPHTVTSGTPGDPTGEFDSGPFGTGQTYARTFDEAGVYNFFCSIHPAMTGTVVVTD